MAHPEVKYISTGSRVRLRPNAGKGKPITVTVIDVYKEENGGEPILTYEGAKGLTMWAELSQVLRVF